MAKPIDTLTWTADELLRIGKAEELDLATRKTDGTLRKRFPVWVVRVGDDVYIRCVGGRTGAWFLGTQTSHAGHIWAGGVDKDITFADADAAVSADLDTAFRTKYKRYAQSIVSHVVSPQARAATLRLLPQ